MNKIFNIGFNKSGTTSLTHACEMLGFRSIHYYDLHKKRLADFIEENHTNHRRLFESLEEYDFFSDFNGERWYKELDEQYPGSRFILTVRDLEEWLDSREKHVIRNQQDPTYRYGFLTVERDVWTEEYNYYQEELNTYFKNRSPDFLVMNIIAGDGWEKLAPFLGKPIPVAPFPRENQAISFESKRPE